MILLCYDGSDDAQAAIERVAQLMPDAEATILTLWEPFFETVIRNGSMGMGMGFANAYVDDPKIDQASQRTALETATEGTGRAAAAGLLARPLIASRHAGSTDAILAAAAELDADVIVLGTRGRSAVKSFLLGSVSHGVVQHADRAVLVVPSPDLAEQRRSWTRHADSTAGIA